MQSPTSCRCAASWRGKRFGNPLTYGLKTAGDKDGNASRNCGARDRRRHRLRPRNDHQEKVCGASNKFRRYRLVELRQLLTGTQLQILQFMEGRREVTITALQEKFSFIPDRELYDRLEQIVLMGFIHRDRKNGEVIYTLNPDYSGRVEDDKTVMTSND
ncbi:MAG: hypothetical protein U5O39_06240 [Gammaproteobacteria bacterium]|nr:hypothetical protein [Gammaproteobacteria bacterium]